MATKRANTTPGAHCPVPLSGRDGAGRWTPAEISDPEAFYEAFPEARVSAALFAQLEPDIAARARALDHDGDQREEICAEIRMRVDRSLIISSSTPPISSSMRRSPLIAACVAIVVSASPRSGSISDPPITMVTSGRLSSPTLAPPIPMIY